MIGDKIIIRQNDVKRAKSVLNKIIPSHSRSVITIGGGSGTSKTELAICLQEELYDRNILTLKISLDDYYKLHFYFRNEERKIRGLKSVGIKEIDWNFLKISIMQFKERRTVRLTEVNKYSNNFLISSIDSRGIDYLIVEGLYAGYLRKLKLNDYAIHLEGTPQQTLKFRKLRKKENEDDAFRKQVVEKEYKETQKLKKYADIIIKEV